MSYLPGLLENLPDYDSERWMIIRPWDYEVAVKQITFQTETELI